MYRFDFNTGQQQPQTPFLGHSTNMTNIICGIDGSQPPPTQYVFDPNQRYQQMSSMPTNNIQTPGAIGYNQQNGYIPNTANGFQTSGGSFGFCGNPALSMLGQQNGFMNQYQMNNRQYSDKQVHVDGFRVGSEALFSQDIEDQCTKLQMEMMVEQEEAIVKRNQRIQGYFNNNYGTNYYGMPFYGNYFDDSVTQKYKAKAEAIRQQAIQKRLSFNKNLSRLAHNFANDGVSDEEIDRIYEGYDFTIPSAQVAQDEKQRELQNMREVSNQPMYAQQFNQTKKMIGTLVGDSKDMNDFLDKQGLLVILDNLEKEEHNRRDGTQYYEQDAYRAYLRRMIRERHAKESGFTENINGNQNQSFVPNFGQTFPTLQQSSSILDDGTISITAPQWLQDRKAVENDMLEQQFQLNRQNFLQSIYATSGVG